VHTLNGFAEIYKAIKELNLIDPSEETIKKVLCRYVLKYWDVMISHITKKSATLEEATQKLFYILNQAMNINQNNRIALSLQHNSVNTKIL